MAYSRVKVWIAAEVLTASDLNNEHNGHITNENDLNTRLIAEIASRSTLETEYDAFYGAAWNAGSSEVAANKVSKSSMKDNAIGLTEIEAAATDPAAAVGGLRTLGTGAAQALPGDTDLTAEDDTITVEKLKDTVAGTYTTTTAQSAEYCHNSTSWTKITEIRIAIGGAIRTKFKLRRETQNGTAYGRLYKNGVGFGTSRSNTSTTGVWYEEDLGNFSAGDLLQLYTKHSSGGTNVCAETLTVSITVPLVNVITLES